MQAALIPSEPRSPEAKAFADALDTFRRALDGQTVISTSRAIDGLLDLYNVTLDPAARRLIETALGDVRFTNAVRTEQLRRALAEIDTAALVDHALGDLTTAR